MKEENVRLVEHIKNLEKFKYDNVALKQQVNRSFIFLLLTLTNGFFILMFFFLPKNDYLLKENEILRSNKCDSLDLK